MNEDQIKFGWRQPTPIMQFVAIMGSLEWWTSSWRNHKAVKSEQYADGRYAEKAAEHSDMLYALRPYLEQGHW
jgi:hypothetical protein